MTSTQALKNMARDVTPPLIWKWLQHRHRPLSPSAKEAPLAPEYVDYYANASWYALEELGRIGDIRQMRLLSATARVPHLGDYAALFSTVYHCSTLQTHLPIPERNCSQRLVLLTRDFFEIEPLDVDCVISHSTFHCLADPRYGNEGLAPDLSLSRCYEAPRKLREIVGKRQVPCFITVAVNAEEKYSRNDSWLSHSKFVEAFQKQGFRLQNHFFDYVTGGARDQSAFTAVEFRRSNKLPELTVRDVRYVAGTYYFL